MKIFKFLGPVAVALLAASCGVVGTKQSTNGKVVFGALPAESSLVEAFKAAKKESSPKYRAALGRKGASLNNIYFENDTNLALYYYRGNTTFKHHVNLASAKITR